MTLRARIATTAAAAVALAFVVAAGLVYLTTARTLRGEVDRSLTAMADDLSSGRPGRIAPHLAGAREGYLGGAGGFVQFVRADGEVVGPDVGQPRLPLDRAVTDVAAGERGPFLSTVRMRRHPVRVLTVALREGLAAQIARPLDEVEDALAALRRRLVLGMLLAVALAAGLGMLVARRAVRPVGRLTAVAEEVAATGDLTRRIELPRPDDADELARLARTFNGMLANLEQARLAQQQLVADASHELRTPLTSLRTNIEVLALDASATDADGGDVLDPADRRRLLDDLTVQLDEFGRLVGALVELTRGARPSTAVTAVRLDEVVDAAVDRARAFAGSDQLITLDADPVTVEGDADRLDRAVANLLDNAVKYGGGQPIDVRVDRPDGDGMTRVAVRDRGPGIAEEHRTRVFERFYRAPETRDAPGSGLGLAIVAQVAEAHGGTVDAVPADGDGAVVTLQLPVSATDGTSSG